MSPGEERTGKEKRIKHDEFMCDTSRKIERNVINLHLYNECTNL